ncbi:MAG TPA: hypothetical protein VLW52_13880 [Opitutaceae bacterium]|nr:hypothetical protein [Opitutaceae bacterium]
MNTRWFFLLAAALMPWCAGGAAEMTSSAAPVGKFTGSAGFDYSTGDYGQSANTDIFAIPVIAQWEVDHWTLKLITSYLHVSGPSNVVSGLGAVLTPGPSPSLSRSGFGDLVTTATYNAYSDSASGLSVDLTGKVKFGTASRSKGLGTGENDLGLQVDVYKSIGAVTPFVSLGYRALGSPPGIHLNDVFFGSMGVDYKTDEHTNVGATFLVQERIADTIDPARELSVYISHRLNNEWRLQAYLVTGFTNASPTFEIGGQVGYTF